MFHGVSSMKRMDIKRDAQPYLDRSEFRSVLQWLSRRFHFLTPNEFLTTERAGVLLTFDDGFANNAKNVLPLLEEYQAPAVFFVTIQHIVEPRNWLLATRKMAIEGWGSEGSVPEDHARDWYDGMSLEQLRSVASHPLITIGAHSVSHPFLTQSRDEQVLQEVQQSRMWLEEQTGRTVDLFAYPTGDYDERIMALTKMAGYRAAFAADGTKELNSPYAIPRIGIYSSKRWYLMLKLSGLHRRPLPARRLI